MKVLLTGASSFTGYWFAKALADCGHHVVAPLRGESSSYMEGARAVRVKRLYGIAETVDTCVFGSKRFMGLVHDGEYDLFCHHAAHVGDYRSPDFNIAGALAENTAKLREMLPIMAGKGLRGVVLTGSVFEQDEGAGNEPLVAFSPYGLSKGLTAVVVQHYCREICLPFGKFVIPNPFGPLEEPRFGAYLIRSWKAGEVARVNTPAYVRDNIHVDLLASAYRQYAEEVFAGVHRPKLNPSGYVETQGVFAQRFAIAMRPRLGLECALELAHQTEFPEPMMRVNTDSAEQYVDEWDENKAWDNLAESYFE